MLQGFTKTFVYVFMDNFRPFIIFLPLPLLLYKHFIQSKRSNCNHKLINNIKLYVLPGFFGNYKVTLLQSI